jgi:hypothetical protein
LGNGRKGVEKRGEGRKWRGEMAFQTLAKMERKRNESLLGVKRIDMKPQPVKDRNVYTNGKFTFTKDSLRKLGNVMHQRIQSSIWVLKNELIRMNGGVVMSDHIPNGTNGVDPYREEYSSSPRAIRKLAKSMDPESSDDNSDSSDISDYLSDGDDFHFSESGAKH